MVGCHKGKKDSSDHAIHGEKGGVQAAEIAWGNQ